METDNLKEIKIIRSFEIDRIPGDVMEAIKMYKDLGYKVKVGNTFSTGVQYKTATTLYIYENVSKTHLFKQNNQ